jgi:dihydroneopterin aldolase
MIDAIRMLVDSGHIPLVETLAERIADALLAHLRVVRVAVRVEKLDLGHGVVGVAIERSRADAATVRKAGRGAGGVPSE